MTARTLSHSGGLGRRTPETFEHVEKYPLRTLAAAPLLKVEKTLRLPWWWYDGQHDQGAEGACVGFGTSLMLAIINSYQAGKTVRYNPWWLWDRSKEIDWWNDTNPGDSNGTSVTHACEILRTKGHVPVSRWPRVHGGVELLRGMKAQPSHGIKENRWATNVDDMRAVSNLGLPMSIGVNWYAGFDTPVQKQNGPFRKGEWVIGEGDLGGLRGGHCVCIYGASDRRQAFKVANSWGRAYPLVWLPYTTMERLIREDGEVALVTDL